MYYHIPEPHSKKNNTFQQQKKCTWQKCFCIYGDEFLFAINVLFLKYTYMYMQSFTHSRWTRIQIKVETDKEKKENYYSKLNSKQLITNLFT